jgi:hypothetical protein
MPYYGGSGEFGERDDPDPVPSDDQRVGAVPERSWWVLVSLRMRCPARIM